MGSLPLVWWLLAGICFIFSLGGLSRHETSRRGNWFGIVGMTIAIIAAFSLKMTGLEGTGIQPFGYGGLILLAAAIGGGTLIGAVLAKRVEMTQMPQLVAILHSFVGLAAVLVGLSNFGVQHFDDATMEHRIHLLEIALGVFIGGVTFTGSIIAWGKLDGRIGSKPLVIPQRHLLNLVMLVASLAMVVGIMFSGFTFGLIQLILVTAISFVLGAHLVMAIGGADMPVVVSMLNSYSGWAAAAVGFMLPNDLLIVTGAAVWLAAAVLF
ncbi:MAG: NAD(P)(+) transhydrogenase (Re/Si-specific) subunit beta [Pirellulaceae bacterium]